MVLTIFNPFDRSPVTETVQHDSSHVELALSRGHEIAKNRNNILPLHKRITILERLHGLMVQQKELLARMALSESGKPWHDTLVEVDRAINGVKLTIEAIGTLHGEQIPMGRTPASAGRLAFTFHEPIGLVVAISAFNHPLNLIIHQVVTAVAAGCPVIVKPSLLTPLSCLKIVQLLNEAGLPEGYCQAIICDNTIAEVLATDPRVNYLSFIGSAQVGWRLRSLLPPGVRCGLEHGGVAPVILAPDANLEAAIPALAKGGFYHAGQVCVSVQRIYVHESNLEEFENLFVQAVRLLKVGEPIAPETQVGPLILPKEVTRVHQWVEEAITMGAKCATGGLPLSETCFMPTVLVNPPDQATISQQEIFGPVVCLYAYKSIEEAVERANNTAFAFQAAVFTNALDTAFYCSRMLRASAVMINDHTAFRTDWMPFGGQALSGLGKGGILYTLKEYLEEKMIIIHF